MQRRRNQLLWIVPVVALLGAALAVVVLVRDARQSGLDSLERSLQGEVSALARSQNQRMVNSLSGTSGLADQAWELTPGSEADLESLRDLLQFIPELRTGFFLTDANLLLTQGVNLVSPDSIGRPYDRAGMEELIRRPEFLRGRGGLLSVGPGLTTGGPNIALVLPILDPATGTLRGTFVFESEVSADSDFNEEIGQLQRGDTGQYLFYDDQGSVIAANDGSLIGERAIDPFLLEAEAGLHDRDGDVVAIAEVPAAGWRIAFTQDREEFESGLSGPLQTVGTLVVVMLLAAAGLVGLIMARRLRASREEQRRLRQLAESQAEFVSIVSHELRTPVAGVLGFLQTTVDHWDQMTDAERLSAVRRASSNARRLQGMARDVLDTQAIESGRMAFVYEQVDLAEEVRSAVDAARMLYEDRRIEVEAPVDQVPIRADSERLHQVLTNLIDNAVKNAPPSEPVAVKLALHNGTAEISVSDRGPGMSDVNAERVFDKFVRGQASAVSGTGLGLYISKQIVEAHDGTITVESEPGAGAVFRIALPIRADGDRPAATPS